VEGRYPSICKTGKLLNKKDVRMHLKFKLPECRMEEQCHMEPNYLGIHIEPDDGIDLHMNAKAPEGDYETVPIKMNFCYSCEFGARLINAYETLIHDVIQGDQSLFVRSDEIEYSWKIIDEVKGRKLKPYSYKKGSKGPKEALAKEKKEGINWEE